jgi:hypothetical protein
MTGILSPFIDRCLFGFVENHKKLEHNMPDLIPLTEQDRAATVSKTGISAPITVV